MQLLALMPLILANTPVPSISADDVGDRMIAVLDCALVAVPKLDDAVSSADVIGKAAVDYCGTEVSVWQSSYRVWATKTLSVLPAFQREEKIAEGINLIRSQMNDIMTTKVLEVRAAQRARRR